MRYIIKEQHSIAGKLEMQIQINPQITTIPEVKGIKPIFTLRICTSNIMETEEPEQWAIPLYPKTTMGVVGGSCVYMTELYDYFGRRIYRVIRMAYDV